MRPAPATRLKLAATALILVPVVVLSLLAVGEIAAGDVSGAQHFIEIVPLLVLLAGGWRYPRVAGSLIMAAGIVLFVAWVFLIAGRTDGDSTLAWAAAGLLLFLPPVLAGWLFLRSARA